MTDIHTVIWGKKVAKQLDRLPEHIEKKFYTWVTAIKFAGIRSVRKHSGFHDEPLKGNRAGQRSVRLNKAFRAIYMEMKSGEIELIEVIEVNHHEY